MCECGRRSWSDNVDTERTSSCSSQEESYGLDGSILPLRNQMAYIILSTKDFTMKLKLTVVMPAAILPEAELK